MSIFENCLYFVQCPASFFVLLLSQRFMEGHTKPCVGYLFRIPPSLMPKRKEESQDQREEQLPSYLTSTLRCGELCFQPVLFPVDSKVSLDKIILI